MFPELPIPRRKLLKDKHPTMQKLQKLMDLADELGLHLSFWGQRTVITDNERDTDLPPLYIEDIESHDGPQEFPPSLEFKIVYDNPDYIAHEKAERDRLNRAQEERKRKEEEARRIAEKKEAERRAREVEDRERRELARLKEKYEPITETPEAS